MISVIIATRYRIHQPLVCLASLGRSIYRQFEVILADQNDAPITIPHSVISSIPSFVHVHVPQGGKSRALNTGITKAGGDIIAFTDDDCIIDRRWLKTIATFFPSHTYIDGMFGKTVPFKPTQHPRLLCPSVFVRPRYAEHHKPKEHWKYIGLGNNMAFRSSVFQKY